MPETAGIRAQSPGVAGGQAVAPGGTRLPFVTPEGTEGPGGGDHRAGGSEPAIGPDWAGAPGHWRGLRGGAGAQGSRGGGRAASDPVAPGLSPARLTCALLSLQIEALPPELFQCRKLRALHLGNNVLQSLPSRVGELTNLTQIELRGNRLECLPVELGECPLLKRSGLVVEEDLFNTLPPEVKERLWRADKEQA